MKKSLLISSLILVSLSSTKASVIQNVKEVPTSGDTYKLMREFNSEIEAGLKSKEDAQKAINLLLQWTLPPKYDENMNSSNLTEQNRIKVAQRVNRGLSRRYHMVKDVIQLAHKFSIKSEDLKEALIRITKFDYATTTRRLAMIGYLSIESDQKRRSELLEYVIKRDGELIFVGGSNSKGEVHTAKFVRGRHSDSLEDLYKFDDMDFHTEVLNIEAEHGDSTLDVPVLTAKHKLNIKVTKAEYSALYKKRLSEFDREIERLKIDQVYAHKFVESDLLRLANPVKRYSRSGSVSIPIRNKVSQNFKEDDAAKMLEEIERNEPPSSNN